MSIALPEPVGGASGSLVDLAWALGACAPALVPAPLAPDPADLAFSEGGHRLGGTVPVVLDACRSTTSAGWPARASRSATGGMTSVSAAGRLLGWVDCTIYAVHEAGDRYVVIGRVMDFGVEAPHPLLFYRGRYARTESEQAAAGG